VAPIINDRTVSGAAAAAPAADLPGSMSQLGAVRYSYVLLQLGWFSVTKRSLSLALALSGLTFAALQSASLCLVTTPPEGMAKAVGRALRPLGLLGLPVKELVLTMLLALRFMSTVSRLELLAAYPGPWAPTRQRSCLMQRFTLA
jgi:hypothetical protein